MRRHARMEHVPGNGNIVIYHTKREWDNAWLSAQRGCFSLYDCTEEARRRLRFDTTRTAYDYMRLRFPFAYGMSNNEVLLCAVCQNNSPLYNHQLGQFRRTTTGEWICPACVEFHEQAQLHHRRQQQQRNRRRRRQRRRPTAATPAAAIIPEISSAWLLHPRHPHPILTLPRYPRSAGDISASNNNSNKPTNLLDSLILLQTKAAAPLATTSAVPCAEATPSSL